MLIIARSLCWLRGQRNSTDTYAKDIIDYTDDDIDTIFDGNPDVYWNID